MSYDEFIQLISTEFKFGFSGDFEDPEITIETKADQCISIYAVDDGLMCSHLDNVIYDAIDDIADDVYEYLSRNKDDVITVKFE